MSGNKVVFRFAGLTIRCVFGEEWAKNGALSGPRWFGIVNGVDEGGNAQCIGQEDKFFAALSPCLKGSF